MSSNERKKAIAESALLAKHVETWKLLSSAKDPIMEILKPQDIIKEDPTTIEAIAERCIKYPTERKKNIKFLKNYFRNKVEISHGSM